MVYQYLKFFDLVTKRYAPTLFLDCDKYSIQHTLDDVLREKELFSKWSDGDNFNCVLDVAIGLDSLHGSLIQHGDLCPFNKLELKSREHDRNFLLISFIQNSSIFTF